MHTIELFSFFLMFFFILANRVRQFRCRANFATAPLLYIFRDTVCKLSFLGTVGFLKFSKLSKV